MTTLFASSVVVSPDAGPFHEDPGVLGFYRDLVEPFGSTVDEQRLRSGRNVFHKDLVDRLVESEELTGATADLVVVTHALPDVHPFTAVASHLNMRLGGGAHSFSVSEQGLAAPFTALRIISAYQRGGRSENAVLAVLEQTTLPTPHPLVDSGELTDTGVLLVLKNGAGLQAEAVESFDDAEATLARLRELAGSGPDTLLVTGPWVQEQDFGSAARVHRVAPGSYCTSVWLDLARHWQQWQRDHRLVVLCDVDPLSGSGHLAVLRSTGTAG
ncbi:hypothetical protein [Streptomyces cavernicola]|uniref:Uncharacterized protein n=1 Tax=Streptomyces cavernicola TaxID=3043613 RepID=A0ABT6SKN7_9ACTN|nr:hypothetical protein [Streptomyces sp. B-S-A6]MDI3408217.1 hypothetical protein [Streptomyces sp. B-S-A6]